MTTTWHDWHDESVPHSNTDDRRLAQQLGWAEGTLAVLRRAFALGLPRQVGWRAPAARAFVDAARYYKRGVVLQGRPRRRAVPRTRLRRVGRLDGVRGHLADRYVICDRRVASLHGLGSSVTLTVVARERDKSLAVVAEILRGWRELGSPLRWAIVGGGITLDVAAFAAALCKAKVVFVPTTLLAMIDAAYGGKNGVNFPPWGKNQLGTFYFPEQVLLCPAWLRTLPRVELQAGGWEGVKHALLTGDRELWQTWLQCQEGGGLTWRLLRKTAQVKLVCVRRDPYERGERRVLNFGHTLAHALEALAEENGGRLRHGHAVAVGMLYAILLSEALGRIKKCPQLLALSSSRAMLTRAALAEALGYETLGDSRLWAGLRRYLGQDKKRCGGRVWILLQDAQPLPRVCPTPYEIDGRVLRKTWQRLSCYLP